MASRIRPLIAGNWKMNGLRRDVCDLAFDLATRVASAPPECDIVICPPATLVHLIAWTLQDSAVALGGQDCHTAASGAHTGDVSAEMLADAGCRYVIVGHSERRAGHGEGDALVRAKAEAAHRAGLSAIVCLGENEAERDAGDTLAVVEAQLTGSLPPGATAADTVIAYEPVWAIGSGRTPGADEIAAVHAHLRSLLGDRLGETAGGMRLLYGGSVKAANAAEILAVAEVNGALVGGASLDVDAFCSICQSCP
ncbi:MAG: triose-phosphate isomerase, partial [Alphaproteobacteria bacterium]